LEYHSGFWNNRKKTGLADYSRLVFETDGSVPTYMAFLLDLYDQIAQIYGNNAILFTGVYGGELFRYLNVTSGLHSDDDLVDFLLSTLDKYRYAPEKVCTMLQLDKADIKEHLKDHVSTYNEADVFKKYIHFKFKKDYKYRSEIEDLDRLFFWTTTPFYSPPFFDYAYKIAEHKKDTLFFRNFLHELDARTCNVK
jgi:asparagine synthase (glutamine-hydrolysing)